MLFLKTDFHSREISPKSKSSLIELPILHNSPQTSPQTAKAPRVAKSISGRVVGVSDGDTLTLLVQEGHQMKVRLNGIDAPESSQPFGKKAKQALSSWVFGKRVQIKINERDRYGRSVADVYVDHHWINASLVQSGHAWVYRQYSKDARLLALEAEAKKQKRGLWRLPESQRIPPWEYRQKRRYR